MHTLASKCPLSANSDRMHRNKKHCYSITSSAQIIHHGSDVVEGAIELFRVRAVAMSEARVIGRDKVITIGKPGEERLEHPRCRGKFVRENKRWGAFRAGLSVK